MSAPPLTLIAIGTSVHGPIDAHGDVTVAGRVEGTIRATGTVRIEAAAGVMGEVRAARVRVDGALIGPVSATEKIDLGPGARVVGDLRAPTIELGAGASVEGKLDHSIPEAEALPQESRSTLRVAGRLPRPSVPPRSGTGESH
jgi:cytoskeletal protein CcmA (bactofilin family)